jgi:hypothetical protein
MQWYLELHFVLEAGYPFLATRLDEKRERERDERILFEFDIIQADQKVSVHLMIIIQKVTSNVQSVPRQSPDIY